MIGILEYVIGMLRILANEVEDTQDGEERSFDSLRSLRMTEKEARG